MSVSQRWHQTSKRLEKTAASREACQFANGAANPSLVHNPKPRAICFQDLVGGGAVSEAIYRAPVSVRQSLIHYSRPFPQVPFERTSHKRENKGCPPRGASRRPSGQEPWVWLWRSGRAMSRLLDCPFHASIRLSFLHLRRSSKLHDLTQTLVKRMPS